MKFSGRGILLDIEGTTSSVSFVYDVMFPFVRRELKAFVESNWGNADLAKSCNLIAVDAGFESLDHWQSNSPSADPKTLVQDEVIRLMDGDVKATGLKHLQGLIWKSGFESGEMQAHLYDDVAPAINGWTGQNKDVRIYSSGSVQAQLLFFGHTIVGNMLDQFQGHYDTTIGGKRETPSYVAIARQFKRPPNEILFLSDVIAELMAAREAGMHTALCVRPGNATVIPNHGFEEIHSFSDVKVS
jgi:enolase-phosphatase E1